MPVAATASFGIVLAHEGGHLYATLSGELDASCRGAIEEVLVPAARRYQGGQIQIDCSTLTFIDLAGLDSLLRVATVAGSVGRITLRCPHRTLRQLLRLSRTDIVFFIVPADQ